MSREVIWQGRARITPCCARARSISKLLRDGRVVYVGSEKVDDVTRHPAFRDAAATVAAIYDMKADPANRDDPHLRGGRCTPFDLFPAPAQPRRPAAAHGGPSQDRRSHLRDVRPLARPRRVLRDRHGDEARRAAGAVRVRRQCPALLPPHPRQRRLCGLCRGAAAGRAQSGVLSQAEHPGADACAWCARTTTASSSPA